MTLSLSVEKRTETGKKLKAMREAGKLPAVVYGPKQEATPITLDAKTFSKMFAEAGESTIITLEGLEEETEVLVQDIAFDPTRGGATHVDFYAIERGKELTTNVALSYEGEAPAIKQGGTLTKVLQEVMVTCRPSLLPSEIVVDVKKLVDFDAQILVKDLEVAEGVKIDADPEDVVALVQAVKEEVETDDAPGLDSIEVEEKGKKEEEPAAE